MTVTPNCEELLDLLSGGNGNTEIVFGFSVAAVIYFSF